MGELWSIMQKEAQQPGRYDENPTGIRRQLRAHREFKSTEILDLSVIYLILQVK